MRYAVDEIIDNIVILENIETKEKKIIKKNNIPFQIQDGTILEIKNKQIYHDKETETKRKKIIQEKLNKVKEELHE